MSRRVDTQWSPSRRDAITSSFMLGLDSFVRRLHFNQDERKLLETFAYVDDLVIISSNLEEVQNKLRRIKNMEEYTGLQISIEKTKIMHLDNRTRRSDITHEEESE